jgi:hypothetical protein
VPNFPPGSPNNVSVTPVALLVFTPTPGVQASARFWNPGPATVYVGAGSNVNAANGFPIPPGNRPVELQNVNVPLYAASGGNVAATSTLTAAALAAGVTTFTLSTATLNATGPGYLKIGNGSAVEYVSYSTITSSSVATVTATQYAHGVSETVSTISAVPGPLSVQAGVH